MDFETISERLISNGIVETMRAAKTTAMYAIQWMHGHSFNFNKKAVQTHRARLRKIGIDIMQRCKLSKFSPVTVKEINALKVRLFFDNQNESILQTVGVNFNEFD